MITMGIITNAYDDPIYDSYDSIPDSAIEYEAYSTAPWGKLAVTDVVIEEGVTSIGDFAFRVHVYEIKGDNTKTNRSIKSIGILKGVTSIGNRAFYECAALTKYNPAITLPDGLKSIGNSAFSNCTALKSIILPDSVASIGRYAFENRSKASITLPFSSEKVDFGWDSFIGCKNALVYEGSFISDIH